MYKYLSDLRVHNDYEYHYGRKDERKKRLKDLARSSGIKYSEPEDVGDCDVTYCLFCHSDKMSGSLPAPAPIRIDDYSLGYL